MFIRLAASVVFLFLAGGAQAATLTTSYDITGLGLRLLEFGIVPTTDNFAFTRFDPAQGTLTQVSLNITGTVSQLETSYTNVSDASIDVEYVAGLTFSQFFSTDRTDGSINSGTAVNASITDQSASQLLTIAPGETATVGPFSFDYDATHLFSPVEIGKFLGTQLFAFTLNASLQEPGSLSIRPPGSPDRVPVRIKTEAEGARFDGTVTLTYAFTPAVTAVPLPASLPLLFGGLAALGFWRSRRAGKTA